MRNSVHTKIILPVVFFLVSFLPLYGQCNNILPDGDPEWTPPLGPDFKKVLFKASLDISKFHLTGLILMKVTSDSSLRIIFTNEMGMNFFDIEYIREQCIVHYCFPSLQRKNLLKILESDFRLLLPEKFSGIHSRQLVKERKGIKVYKIKSVSGRYYFRTEPGSDRIKNIDSSGKIIDKTRIRIDNRDKPSPARIILSNPTIRLHIKLTLMDL